MIAALAFLTPIPVGRGRVPDGRSLRWFPVVGLAVGAVLSGVWAGASHLWNPFIAAVLVVIADLGLTGMLHFDGLVDTADGVLSHLDRDRRLRVMAQPDVGAFGLGVGAALLLLRVACISALHPTIWLLPALWCLSRTVMAVGALTLPYARAEGDGGKGLVTTFLRGAPPAWVVGGAGLLWATGLAVVWRLWPGLAAVGGGIVGGAGVLALGRFKLGGFTGDVLGAAGVVAETLALLVAAARW